MSYEQEFDHNIIVRFLLQDASEEDVEILQKRILKDSAFRTHFEQIRGTWNRIEIEKDLDDSKIQRDLEKVLAKTSDRTDTKLRSIFSFNSWFFRAAAIFVIGFGISWAIFRHQNAKATRDVTYHTIEIPKGSSSIVSLPDGTKITLNAQSKLKYPNLFTGSSRSVFLEGEAFFEVAKDKDRLFEVNTPELLVKVHGTSFNIKSYADESTVETTLVEGSISLFKKSGEGEIFGKEIKMEPNQQLVLYKGANSPAQPVAKDISKQEVMQPMKPKLMLSKRIDTERYVSWKDGSLKIKSEPLSELAVTLERRYNVNIHFGDEQMMQYRFSGTIRDETIEQVMSAIKLAAAIDYEIEDRNIYIKRKE